MESAASTGTLEAAAADGDATGLVRTLSATVFLQWLGASAIIPMLPVFVRRLGGSDVDAGVVMASFFAAQVLLQYPTGRLADRIGRRPVLITGLLLFGAASVGFLAPITPADAVLLRALQGAGAGAAGVASLAMISGSVALERRGRAFAAVYGGEIAGLAVGPLVGSVIGARSMWIVFLGSAVLSIVASVAAMRITNPDCGRVGREGTSWARAHHRLVVGRAAAGALLAGSSLGLTTGVYEICWTLLLVSKGASGLEIGISWTLFAVPFVAVSKPSGWLADHVDRRVLVVGGIGSSALLCASYPFIPSVPVLVVLGATEAMSFAAALPAMQSLLTQGADPAQVGRLQGLFATGQTACTAVAAAAAGAAFAAATWLPFVAVAVLVLTVLSVTWLVWRPVSGHVRDASDEAWSSEPIPGPEGAADQMVVQRAPAWIDAVQRPVMGTEQTAVAARSSQSRTSASVVPAGTSATNPRRG
ncbi:MAG: MFS transporter [Acidimicrobiales bacterium]